MKFPNRQGKVQYLIVPKFIRRIFMVLICLWISIGGISGARYAEASQDAMLHAFYPSNGVFSEQLQGYIDDVDSLSFAWSRIDSEEPSVINTEKGKNDNFSFYYPTNYLQPIEYAKQQGKSIQMNIYMDGSDSSLLLPYADKRSVMIQAITDFLQKDISEGKGIYYDGVVIDFEGLRNTADDRSSLLYNGKWISEYYSIFLTELKAQLTLIGRTLYVAVNPGNYYDGYDYSSIMNIADRVILMAHDYEPTERLQKNQVQQYTGYNALQPISSMAPAGAVRQALSEMKAAAADESELSKVWLQITFDSAQWRFDVNGEYGWEKLDSTSLSREGRLTPLYKSIKTRVDNADGKGRRIAYGYNNELQTPYIQYYNSTDQSWNIILYEDSNSISAKIDLARSFGLGGISIWSLANVPDYTDAKGMEYHLDGWTTLLDRMSSFAAPVASDQTITFTDASIEKAVREKLFQPQGKIAVAEVKNIYRLKLSKGVTSLKDLKYLTNLEYLNAQQLGIRDISDLSGLTKLRALYLQRNNISDLNALKKLTKLEVLSLNGNRITSLSSLTSLTKLRELYLRENSIADISPLNKMTKLEILEIGENNITKIDAVKNMKQMRQLALDNNKITDIGLLKSLTELKQLYLQRNSIHDITALAALKNTTLVSLNGNKVTNLKPISKLAKLEKLYLKDNTVTNVSSLKGLTSLKELYLSGNRITDYSVLKNLLLRPEFKCDFK